MFEYLMPSLVMRAPAGSLLGQTSHLVVRRQIGYGAALGVPAEWHLSAGVGHGIDPEGLRHGGEFLARNLPR